MSWRTGASSWSDLLYVSVCVRGLGVYLPLLWEQSFCWKSPIALGYTRGHFSALVAMENDGYDNRGAGANLNTDDDVTVTFLPLVDSERKLLHIHFLSAQEVGATFYFQNKSLFFLKSNLLNAKRKFSFCISPCYQILPEYFGSPCLL